MRDYGSDKPDLRVPLEADRADRRHEGGRLQGFPRGGRAAERPRRRVARARRRRSLTRKEIDDYTRFVTIYGAKGLAYIKVNDAAKPNEEGLQSPIVKFLSRERAARRSWRAPAQRSAT